MNIQIKEVNEFNRQEILKLRVKDTQVGYIESVEECLQESEEVSLWRPVGLYRDELLIGFAMYGLWQENGEERVWLDRFLIAADYQGQGLGKQSLNCLLKHIFDEYQCQYIYLSLYDDNQCAFDLYRKFAFVVNGEKDIHGETVMIKKRINQ